MALCLWGGTTVRSHRAEGTPLTMVLVGPQATLESDGAAYSGRDGNFYGSLIEQSKTSYAVVFFKIRATVCWLTEVVHNFDNTDGYSFMQRPDGNFYGTTARDRQLEGE